MFPGLACLRPHLLPWTGSRCFLSLFGCPRTHLWILSEEVRVCGWGRSTSAAAQPSQGDSISTLFLTFFFFAFNCFSLFVLPGAFSCSPKSDDPHLEETQMTPHSQESSSWKTQCLTAISAGLPTDPRCPWFPKATL